MSNNESDKAVQEAPKSRSKFLLTALRFLGFAAAVSGFSCMLASKQSVSTPYGTLHAKYHYSPAFIYYVVAITVTFVYALIAIIMTPLSRTYSIAWTLFLLDMFTSYLALSGTAAAAAVAWVGKKGNSHSGWDAICGIFGYYCNRIIAAVVCGFLAFLFLSLAAVVQARQLVKYRL